jgi:hypothetical protein
VICGSPFTGWAAFNLDMTRRLMPNHAVNTDVRRRAPGRAGAIGYLTRQAAIRRMTSEIG